VAVALDGRLRGSAGDVSQRTRTHEGSPRVQIHGQQRLFLRLGEGLRSRDVRRNTHVESGHDGTLPLSASFLSADAENVVLSVLKKSEDGDAIIVRGYETAGKRTKTSIPDPHLTFSSWHRKVSLIVFHH